MIFKGMIIKRAKNSIINYVVMEFIIFYIIFSVVTLPFILFYGPFEKIKKTTVGTLTTTRRLQFLVKCFLSKEQIDSILQDSYAIDPTKNGEKLETLKFKNNGNDKIELYDIKGKNFKGKLLLISNPLSIKIGYSSKLMVNGERTSFIARRNNAAAAINAGGFIDYKWTSTGGIPLGFVISDGKIIYDDQKDMTVERDTIGFTNNGMLIVGMHSIKDLNKYGIKEGVSFGPSLVVNGEPTIADDKDGGWGIAPRTAIGQRKDGTVIFLVIDGRSLKSIGASLKDVQDILLKYRAYNAANLDGGSSTTMYYNRRVINNPADSLGERSVPTAFLVIPDGVNLD